jgi:hypothetical protein
MARSIYQIQALADIAREYLTTVYGEYLILTSSSNYDLAGLEKALETGKYEAKFRLFVLHPDETINYEIPQSDIILGSGNYNENYQNGQRRNLNINLVNKEGKYTPSINTIWVQNKFRFDIGISFGGETYWFPRGIFIMGNPSSTHQDSDKQVTLTLEDKFALLEGKMGTLETTYEIPAGTLIKDAIESILTIDTGAGYPLDLKPILYDHNFDGIVTPYTITKDPGSNFGEMILELANMLGAECFYNDIGNLCFIDINETIQDLNKPIIWHYSDEKKEFLDSSTSYDFGNVVNEVHVVGDNVNGKIFSAIASNNDPASPICIKRIGRHIEYINDSAIYSDKLAQDRANYELRCKSIVNTSVSISTTFNPLIFVDNIITIEDSFYNFKRERFVIQSISYNIGVDNKMSITLSNITNANAVDDTQNRYLADNAHNFITTAYGEFMLVGGR